MSINNAYKKKIGFNIIFSIMLVITFFVGCFLVVYFNKDDDKNPPSVGGEWNSGIETPSSDSGSVGDFYFKSNSLEVFKYCDNGWIKVVSLNDLVGVEGAVWHYGNNAPSQTVGSQNDYYLDQVGGDVYHNGVNGWEKVFNVMGKNETESDNGEDLQVYVGYDGYVWVGDSRTEHKSKTIVGVNNVVDNTLELKNEKYFTNKVLDVTTHAVALMSGYQDSNEYATSSYSHTTITNISVYVENDGVLELGVAKTKDCVTNVTSGQEIVATNKATVDVNKGLNNLVVNFVVSHDETLILGGGNTTAKLFMASGVESNDDYGVFSTYNTSNNKFNVTEDVKDKLIVKVKATSHTIKIDSYVCTETTHGRACNDCTTIYEIENHTYQNGKCSVCDYSHLNHTSTTFDNITETNHSKICDVCGATFASGSHNYGEFTQFDNEKHYKQCLDCDYKLYTNHNFENGVCENCDHAHTNHVCQDYATTTTSHSKTCDVCGLTYILTEHTFGSYVSDGKIKHYKQCSVCEYKLFENHDFENSTCEDCGYTCSTHEYENGSCGVCGHEHDNHVSTTFDNITETNHSKICDVCGVEFDKADHNWSGDTCDVCDYECEHKVLKYEEDDGIIHRISCETCNTALGVASHHLVNDVCSDCGHVHTCLFEWVIEDDVHYKECCMSFCGKIIYYGNHVGGNAWFVHNNEKHCNFCKDCGTLFSIEDHDFENGHCSTCGFDHMNHTWLNGECSVCHLVCEHNYDAQYYCTICGYHNCLYYGYVSGGEGLSEDVCVLVCMICDETIETYHRYSNGTCYNCGYAHQNHVGEITFTFPSYHSKMCDVCGVEFDEEDHIWENGECSICEYEHEDHNFGEYSYNETTHSRTCGKCDYVETETHEMENCVCGKCDYREEHTFGEYEAISNEQHSAACTKCGLVDTGVHSYTNDKCNKCGHDCIHLNYTNGKCEACGSTHDCESNKNYSYSNTQGDAGCNVTCATCGVDLGLTDHVYQEGSCKNCKHEHINHANFSYGLEYDPEYWHEVICGTCGYFYGERHSYTNNKCVCGAEHYEHTFYEGVCDNCGYECEPHVFEGSYCEICGFHDCSLSDSFTYSSMNGDNSCIWICACGEHLETEHWYADGKCVNCKYEHSNHDYGATSYYQNFNETSHYRTCKKCSLKDYSNHRYSDSWNTTPSGEHYKSCLDCYTSNYVYESCVYDKSAKDGVCLICKVQHFEFEHTYEDCVCTKCGIENHDWHSGTCYNCGSVHTDHEIDYDCDESFHFEVCKICGEELFGSAAHTWENDICTVCKYKCAEDHSGCECEYCNYDGHDLDEHCFCEKCENECHKYVNGKCSVCEFEHVDHVGDERYYCIDENIHYVICDVCGSTYGSPLEHAFWYEEKDDNNHYKNCVDCGFSEIVEHNFVDGECSQCYYEHQNHAGGNSTFKNVEYHEKHCEKCNKVYDVKKHVFNESYSCNDYYHWKECVDCGYRIDEDEHVFQNYKCTSCGHECVNHEWEDENCYLCGKWHGHVWENYYCTVCDLHDCDAQGIFEYGGYDYDYHHVYCEVCFSSWLESHNWNDTRCDICGEEHDHKWKDGVCEFCETWHDCVYVGEYIEANIHDHYQVCECGNKNYEGHTIVNSVCVECGHKHETCFDNTENGYNYYDDNTHSLICELCYKNFDFVEHNLGEELYFNEDAHYHICNDCGFEKHEVHIFDDCVCVDCRYENHDWSWGECCDCSKVCEHENISNDECLDCGYNCNEYTHIFDESNYCAICGEHDCEGVKNYIFAKAENVDNDNCGTKTCNICQKVKVVCHEYGYHTCNNCGFEHVDHVKTSYIYDKDMHYNVCSVCKYDNATEHTFTNSTCTVCGYKCETHISNSYESIDDENHATICDVCRAKYDIETHNYIMGTCSNCGHAHLKHEWNGSSTCAVCGGLHAHEYGSYVSDGDKHYRTCKICGYVQSASHFYAIGSTQCSVCGRSNAIKSIDE